MKATEITEELEQQIIEYYKNNAARDTAKQFHIRPSRLNEILAKHNIDRHATVKTDLTDGQIRDILDKYPITTDLTICKEFHITKSRLHRLLEQNNIQKHTEAENRSIAKTTDISQEAKLELIEYYATHNITDTCFKF